MKKEHSDQSAPVWHRFGEAGFFNPRAAIILLACAAACLFAAGTLLALLRDEAPSKVTQRTLTFAERVVYQRAIEDVYWRHHIWPRNRGESPTGKPSLDAVISQSQLESKVDDYVRKSQALEAYWHRPITGAQLQAEMERMAQHSKQPEVLRELFAALGNDAFVVAECLAKPALTERLIGDLSALENKKRFEYAGREDLRSLSMETSVTNGGYTLPRIGQGNSACTDDSWAPTCLTNAPAARAYHSAVWTGTEMIVWGGLPFSIANTGARYNPGTDNWTAISTANAPSRRFQQTAVWTGSEMIVWGGTDGYDDLNTGGRYNPSTDSWTPTMTRINAPSARTGHTAVWTGSEMIVWGGVYQRGGPPEYFDSGARYNPSTDTWTATSTNNAPIGRELHTAVWTGNEMIVWGGQRFASYLNTGGRYNPITDTWTTTSTGNTLPRAHHTAVWTGSEMIVWGGVNDSGALNTGTKYSPGTNSWTATSTSNAPSARGLHTSVWCGSEMIIWGGGNYLDSGGRYNPITDIWTATSTIDVPTGRVSHTAVWTGSEMIVWGGGDNNTSLNSGGRYGPTPAAMCPATPTPTTTPWFRPTPTPRPRPTLPPPPPLSS